AVHGARATRVERRGKFVVVSLERSGGISGALLVHLRMTGRLQVQAQDLPLGPHVRVCCDLDDGRRLVFGDVRKFVRFLFTRRPADVLGRWGREPLLPEFTPAWLATELARRRGRLKSLLLDQGCVAGLGNIYVDESLHRARLHPLRAANSLSRAEVERLV